MSDEVCKPSLIRTLRSIEKDVIDLGCLIWINDPTAKSPMWPKFHKLHSKVLRQIARLKK